MKNQMDLKRKAYQVIKDKIIRCELLPGEDISEEALAREVGMSRTPVREALMRLENENLIRIYPRKGIVVASISPDTINDIFGLREIIEPQVLEMTAGLLSREWLEQMMDRFGVRTHDFWKFVDLDKEFHTRIVKASRNRYLMQIMGNIYDQNQRIRVLSSRDTNRLDVSNKEHAVVIFELLSGKVSSACNRLKDHLHNARLRALDIRIGSDD